MLMVVPTIRLPTGPDAGVKELEAVGGRTSLDRLPRVVVGVRWELVLYETYVVHRDVRSVGLDRGPGLYLVRVIPRPYRCIAILATHGGKAVNNDIGSVHLKGIPKVYRFTGVRPYGDRRGSAPAVCEVHVLVVYATPDATGLSCSQALPQLVYGPVGFRSRAEVTIVAGCRGVLVARGSRGKGPGFVISERVAGIILNTTHSSLECGCIGGVRLQVCLRVEHSLLAHRIVGDLRCYRRSEILLGKREGGAVYCGGVHNLREGSLNVARCPNTRRFVRRLDSTNRGRRCVARKTPARRGGVGVAR